jgi:hypothetical protein
MLNPTIPLQAEAAPIAARVERRAFVRYPAELETSCKPFGAQSTADPEMNWDAVVRDLSVGGIGLRLGRRFERGTLLVVELPDNSDGSTRYLTVRVVHVTAEISGEWILGCRFTRSLSDEEVQAILVVDSACASRISPVARSSG